MAFPTTIVLENCNRANESPISNGGKWSGPLFPGDNQLNLLSNQINRTTSGGDSYWNTSFPADQECYVTALDVTATYYQIWVRINSPNNAALNGYIVQFKTATGVINVQRVDNSSTFVTLTPDDTGITFVNKDQLGVRIVGSTISVFRNSVQVSTRTDATYAGAGIIGITCSNSKPAVNFGGGLYVPVPRAANAPLRFVYDRKNR